MYNHRKVSVTMRIKPDLMQTIDELAVSEFEGNVTSTIESLAREGLELRKMQDELEDNPEKLDEIVQKLEEKRKDGSIFAWIDTLEDRQKRAVLEYIQMNRD